MKKRLMALITAIVMAAATVGVAGSIVSHASDTTTAQTPKKCKKCKKIVKKAKKCKKSGSNSAKCKKLKKKAKKCKKVLRSKKCKKKPTTKPSPKPSGSAGEGTQEVTGEIIQPNPVPDDPEACYAGKHRRELILTDGANQGVDGYHFDVEPSSQGRAFTLTVDGGEGEPDLDITYYTEYGTPEQAADTSHAPPNQAFEKRAPGGEAGVVPNGMNVAIICMLNGANVSFTYKAAGPVVGGGGGASPSPSASPSASGGV